MIKSILLTVVLTMLLVMGCQDTRKTAVPVVVSSEKSKVEVEKILSKWIYEHSNKISQNTANEIAKEAMKTNKPLLIVALTEVESNFIPSAVSNKGAVGLTQVMFDIHKLTLVKSGIAKEKRDLFDVAPSIQAGNLVLDSCLLQSKGDVSKALELYLGGQDGAYLKKILSNLANLYILAVNHKVEGSSPSTR